MKLPIKAAWAVGVLTASLITSSLWAGEVLMETRLGENEPRFVIRKGLQPEASSQYDTVSDGPGGAAATVLRWDDSAATKDNKGQYLLSIPFTAVDKGTLSATVVLRIPEAAGDAPADFRVCVGGKEAKGDFAAATYVRALYGNEGGRWTVFNPEQKKHQRVSLHFHRGEWLQLDIRISVAEKQYTWRIKNLVSGDEQVAEAPIGFFQPAETLTNLSFISLERGGMFEVASVKVEAE